MLKFRSLTNVRPTKDLGCQIICAPTEGQFKVTPDAAKVLDVANEDYLQLVEADGTFYAVKGGDGLGGKLAASNKTGSGILTFSAAAAWQEMGGDVAFNTHFDVDAENAVVDGEGEDAKTYYPLTLAEKVEKQSRKRKDGSEAEIDDSDEDLEDVDTSFDDM